MIGMIKVGAKLSRQLDLSREFAALKEKRRLLRRELAKLVVDREELLHTVKPNLEASYYTAIGREQHRLFTVRNEVLRTRRQIELIQAALNRGEEPDLKRIEKRLDEEMRQWIEELQELGQKVRWAEYREQLPVLSASEARELKQLYRKLVRKLHPDFNEALPENFRYLWERVNTAYRNGDLEELQTLALLLSREEAVLPELSTMEQLAADVERLTESVEKILKQISVIQEQFPFNVRDKLADKGWVEAQRNIVAKQLDEMEQHRLTYRSILAKLGGGSSYFIH